MLQLLITVLFAARLTLAQDPPTTTSLSSPHGPKIVLFGDSLSDNGSGIKQLFDTFPYSPYFNGHFTNGPVWIEKIPSAGLTDYAYGGAAVSQAIVVQPGAPSLATQINDHLISTGGKAQVDTFYVIFGGANDVWGNMSNDTLKDDGTTGHLAYLPTCLSSAIMGLVKKLATAGATDVLVMGVPDFSLTPGFKQLYSPAQGTQLSNLTQHINNGIIANILASQIKNETTGVNIKFFDTAHRLQEIYSNPLNYYLENVTSPCLENWQNFGTNVASGQGPEMTCQDPMKFYFWDAFHPTARVHDILAYEVMKVLKWPTS